MLDSAKKKKIEEEKYDQKAENNEQRAENNTFQKKNLFVRVNNENHHEIC